MEVTAILRSTLDRILNDPLFTLGHERVTALTLAVVIAVVLATIWLARLSRIAVQRGLALRGHTDAGTVGVTTRLVQYGIGAMGLGIAAQTLGINLGALFAAGAFFAVALGFAMQNVAQNFVAGIILLTERTIKPGDVLEVGSEIVRVSRIGLRATVARSRDEETLIIPNSILVQETVTNFTMRDVEYRLRATVGVRYESDLAAVKRVLQETADALSWRSRDHTARVLLAAFGDSAVDFEVAVWTQDPWNARVARSDLLEAIWWAFRRANIRLASQPLDGPVDQGLSAAAPGVATTAAAISQLVLPVTG